MLFIIYNNRLVAVLNLVQECFDSSARCLLKKKKENSIIIVVSIWTVIHSISSFKCQIDWHCLMNMVTSRVWLIMLKYNLKLYIYIIFVHEATEKFQKTYSHTHSAFSAYTISPINMYPFHCMDSADKCMFFVDKYSWVLTYMQLYALKVKCERWLFFSWVPLEICVWNVQSNADNKRMKKITFIWWGI